MDLTDPIAVALDIAEVLQREGTKYALCGGLLLAAYGQARETKDADVAVAGADAAATSSLLASQLGLHCTVAFEGRRFGGLAISRITLISGDELNTLDLVEPIDADYAARALARAPTSTLRRREIRVLTPEDFVLFKILSTRELDMEESSSNKEMRQRLYKLWDSVSANLGYQWTVAELAEEVSISPQHLYRVSMRLCGHKPMEMVTLLRMRQAE